MNQAETPKSLQSRAEEETEQLSSSVVEAPSAELDDSQLDTVVGGDGNDDSSQKIIIFRTPV